MLRRLRLLSGRARPAATPPRRADRIKLCRGGCAGYALRTGRKAAQRRTGRKAAQRRPGGAQRVDRCAMAVGTGGRGRQGAGNTPTPAPTALAASPAPQHPPREHGHTMDRGTTPWGRSGALARLSPDRCVLGGCPGPAAGRGRLPCACAAPALPIEHSGRPAHCLPCRRRRRRAPAGGGCVACAEAAPPAWWLPRRCRPPTTR